MEENMVIVPNEEIGVEELEENLTGEAEQQQEEDLAILTWAFLQNAHDNYTRQGWCTAAEKEQVLNMHKSYAAKGRNHLSASYEQDILALPETPQEGRRSK